MGKEQVLFSLADDPESYISFDAPKVKARTNIGDSPVEFSRDMSNKKTEAKISRDFGPFELTGKVGRQNKENTASLRADSDRAFIEASKNPYNRALSAGYSDGNFNANFQRSLPNDGGRPSNSLNLGYKTTFADGGPAQQVTQFQPTFSQQGLGSIQQAPDTPAMESTPQDYYSQYAPTQQYNAPAANPMTAGLGSYMEGLKYQAPPPPPAAPAAAPAARNYSWNSGKYADEAALRGALGTYATQNSLDPSSVDTWMGDQATYGISSTPAAPSTTTAYNPQTQQYTAPTAPVEPAAPAQTAQEIAYQKFKAEQDEINAIMSTQGGSAAGGRIHAYAQGGSIPQGIASLGRGQDSMLVHMTPGEVQGLQRLAMAHGGSLTINPQTGLPEAGILSTLLPLALGFALGPAGFGMTSLGAAATVGGVGALATGSLAKGLMYGLGSYGGATLGDSLAGMGTEQANKLASTELAAGSQAATSTGNASADAALRFAEANKEEAIQRALAKSTADNASGLGDGLGYSDTAYRAELIKNPIDNRLLYNTNIPADFATNSFTKEGVGFMQGQGSTGADIAQLARESAANASPMPTYSPATQEALARSPVGNAVEGIKQLGTKEGLKNLGGKLGYAGMAGLAAPLISSAMQPNKFAPPAKTPTQYYKADYKPPKFNELTGTYDPASYGQGSYYTDPTQYAAEGGAVGYKQGGIGDFYPLTGDDRGPGKKPQYSSDIYDDDSGAGVNDNTAGRGVNSDARGKGIYEKPPSTNKFAKTSADTLSLYLNSNDATEQAEALAETRRRSNAPRSYRTVNAAQGGLMGLNTYAAGGKLLRGPGDGMSDSIPAVINGAKPQRAALADGEFVIPADVVSHLGNGSTEAGSRQLYAMMNKVRKARTGNPKQGKQINPERFIPA